jgi:histidyl-tRNA synthetase
MGNPINSIIFENTLVRGLDYYTGLIFEVVLKENPNSLSLCGGGRYDNLIGMFGNNHVPAVGFSVGFDRTLDVIKALGKLPDDLTTSKVLVTILPGYDGQSISLAQKLRADNINTEVYLELDSEGNPPRLDRQLKYADRKGIPYIVIIGPDEVKNNTVTVKNLKTREQKTVSLDQLPNELK